jgi:hypothetical protein
MVKSISYFEGRKLVIATKHKKECVIGPPLKTAFGLDFFSSVGFDTDDLGTFSGEIERLHHPMDAARIKCNMGMDLYNVDLAISSEGSFGPHPHVFFLPADEEYLMLVDRKNNLEITVKTITTDTNYGSITLLSIENLSEFLTRVKFPSHGLILKKSAKDNGYIEKGIVCEKTLFERVDFYLNSFGQCYLETDMRATFNPTRMQVIKELVEKLVVEMLQICPKCNFPGFSVTEVVRGLVCADCNMPTKSVKELIRTCKKCHYSLIEINTEIKKVEDPMYCDFCNP